MTEFGISMLFQYFMYIWPNSILFQGLENQFDNSISRGNPVKMMLGGCE